MKMFRIGLGLQNFHIRTPLVSVPAVRVFSGSGLATCFDLASRGYTFVGSAFCVLFQKVSGLSLVLTFKVRVSASV